jgi:uncharacterized protein (DUF1330 family)
VAAYLIVQVEVSDPVRYEGYKKMVPPSIEKYGGRFLVRGGTTHTLEGAWTPKRFVMVEFPSVEQAKAWWASPEYAEARALRWATADSMMIVAEGI